MKQLLQGLIFEPNNSEKALLYQRGDCELTDEGCLRINKGGSVSFDTYFNLFQPFIWRKYTLIEHLEVAATMAGGGILELWETDSYSGDSCLACQEFHNAEPGKVMLTFLELADAPDHLYIKVTAIDTDVTIQDGGFYSPDEVKREVRIACCFCTYKREKDITRNCEVISRGIIENEASRLYNKTDVYVSDNGQTLTPEMFGDMRGIYLYKNKNYGGSAGFTRCMMEAMGYTGNAAAGKYTHLILMDDDAATEPHVLEKTAALLENIKDEYANALIGGAMLNLDVPYMQMVNGETVDMTGWMTDGRRRDLRLKDVILANHQSAQGNYSAWFYACFPSEVIESSLLPIPFFMHGDDIEYSLRTKSETIKLNGICVWHPNFAEKRRTHTSYYRVRNLSIINAVHFNETLKNFTHRLTKEIVGDIGVYEYEIAQNRLRGARDFLRGMDWLVNLDAEEYNTEVMSWKGYERIKLDPDTDIEYEELLKKETPGRKLRMIKNWFVPAKISRKYYHNDAGTREIDCYRTKEVCIVDDNGKEAVLLKKSYRKALAVCLQYIGVCVLAALKFNKVSNEWRKRHEEAESVDFWLRYLDI